MGGRNLPLQDSDRKIMVFATLSPDEPLDVLECRGLTEYYTVRKQRNPSIANGREIDESFAKIDKRKCTSESEVLWHQRVFWHMMSKALNGFQPVRV